MQNGLELVVIGGGIVGLATAYSLQAAGVRRLVVVEAESEVGAHQTGHNSGVIHSGLYYRPGSLKARNCVEGRAMMVRFCEEQGIAHEVCGKLVVATTEAEVEALKGLQVRGAENGLEGIAWLSGDEMREIEPHVAGLAGLRVPQTGIVKFGEVARALARLIVEGGGEVRCGTRVEKVDVQADGVVVSSGAGEIKARGLINCAGLHSDRIARMCGVDPGVMIIPFRGEYYELVESRRSLVRHLIYPVPDPRFPFLGVHFTRMIGGGVEAGPNAVLAWSRHGYRHRDVSLRDLKDMAGYRGFWNMGRAYWRTGLGEFTRSLSKTAFARALGKLVPEIRADDLIPGGAGVRAQAVGRDGRLLDDFHVVPAPRMVHVLNAPSPAATSSLSIGRKVAEIAKEAMGWPG
ncbi:MAG TPA: L-2-hydroxyglutarate oxidase [Kiritimatiellia bacterium]|nr:L-2-hydroxyglutarate oxidase [Kiritimatiellia bacterium]